MRLSRLSPRFLGTSEIHLVSRKARERAEKRPLEVSETPRPASNTADQNPAYEINVSCERRKGGQDSLLGSNQ